MLLFVDYEVPHYDLYAGSRTNFMYLQMLAGMGLEVKFLPGDFRRVEPYSSELNKLGIETLDGFKFNLEDGGWLLVRFSGTEPLIRVYCETTHQDKVQAILKDGIKLAGID